MHWPSNTIVGVWAGWFALSICVSACAGDLDWQQTVWTTRDSAGVTLVSNQSEAVAWGCVTISPDPVTVVPSSVASPPLYRVRGGRVLEDGRIVVLNAGNKQLLFFGSDGVFQRVAGRSGSGPGEFEDPTWLGHGGNDTLFVWDSRLNRLSIFDGAGALLGSHQVRQTDWRDVPGAFDGRFADGSFYVKPGSLVFFDGTPGIVRPPEAHGRYHLETRQAEGIYDGKGLETVSGGDRIYPLPFGKEEIAIARGDALVVGDNGTSTLRYYDLTGQLRRVVEWVFQPIAVTDRDKTEFGRAMERYGPAAQLSARARFADDRPRFSSIESDQIGWVWVRSYHASWEPSGVWLVFDEQGVLRCSIDLPFRPLQIGATHILGVQRTEEDEETVLIHILNREG